MAWDSDKAQAAPQWAGPQTNPEYNRDACLVQWNELAQQLEKCKAAEIALRNYILKNEFPNAIEGTENIELGKGFKLKGVFKQTYNLDKDEDKIQGAIDRVAKIGNEGTFLADRLLNWKPELVVSEYKKLAENYKTIMQEIVTVKPAQASLEIVAPKVGK